MLAMTARNGAGQGVAWRSAPTPFADAGGVARSENLISPASPEEIMQADGQDSGNRKNSVAPMQGETPEVSGPPGDPSPANAPARAKSGLASVANAPTSAPQDPNNKNVIHIRMVKVPGEQWVGYVFQRQPGTVDAADNTAAYELVKVNLHGVASGPKWMLNVGSVLHVNKEKPALDIMRLLASLRR